MRVEVKKLFRGYASVRSYIVEQCIKEKDVLEIVCNQGIMTILAEDIEKKKKQLFPKKFKSKYNDSYFIYVFIFSWYYINYY